MLMALNNKLINKRTGGARGGAGGGEEETMTTMTSVMVVVTTCSDRHNQKWQIQKENDMVTLEERCGR
jgi:hypothetical protein